MTLYIEEDDHGTEYLVSSSGNTEARIKLDEHERTELKKIADDL